MPRKGPIVPADLYRVRMPMECRLSPDGKRLLVPVAHQTEDKLETETHLWAVDLDGPGSGTEPGSARRDRTRRRKPERPPARVFTSSEKSESSPRWSPDGSRVAFLSSRSGRTELWTMPAHGGEATRLTTLDGSISGYDWFPDGRRLAVAFCAQDDEQKARADAKKKGEPGADSVRVRPIQRLVYKIDGSGFLPRSRTHLWTVDADSGKARQLLDDDRYEESEPHVSPDGKWIYFVSNRSEEPDLDLLRSDVWRIPSRGGELEKVRTFAGPCSEISISPDGRWLAFLGSPDPDAPWNQHHTKLYLVPAGGGRPVELTERLDRDCTNSTAGDVFAEMGTPVPVWSPDSEWIYFIAANEGSTELWRVSRRERRPEPVIADPGVVLGFAIDFAGGWIHYTFADPSNPGEIYSRTLPEVPAAGSGGGRTRGRAGRVTRRGAAPGASTGSPTTGPAAAGEEPASAPIRRSSLNDGWLQERRVALPEVIWFEGKGHHPVQGWILVPPGARKDRKHPGVLYIHGGPGTQYGHAFFHEFQVLAARGYVVFYSNPRGGTGYGEKHRSAIIGRWGSYDYDDLMKFTDTVLRRYRFVDRTRLAVAGGSYGGFMTNWIIGHTHRFVCAITQRCISNWLSFLGASDFGPAWRREFGGVDPWEDPMRYIKASPLYYVRNMRTPTLIEHQEEDHRCPIDQGEQLWAALRSRGVPCEFVRYPAEPHGMSRTGRPDRRIDRLERITDWLDRWLRK